MACVGDAGRGRSDPQRPPGVPDRGFSDPKAGIVAKLVGDFALATLERLGKLVRGGNTDRDRFACIVEYGDFRRIIAIISSHRDACFAANGDATGQSEWLVLVEVVQN